MSTQCLNFVSYYPLIYHTLHKLQLPPHEDYLQDAYLVYAKCVKRYQSERCKFSTYFSYQLFYYYKSLKRKINISYTFVPTTFVVNDQLDEQLFWYDIYTNYGLTDFEKEILSLTLLHYTIEEIAHKIKSSPSTIKRKRNSIKNKLSEFN
ncbi:sigma-70 family RNA polymerase sigma factor [Halobacillus andaensis]|uniref:sigma-70 family RNA polymerase sigma factor n=1 Tax=Halobacillus andaensis TaxID=1176239 RepID=UPI003D755A31